MITLKVLSFVVSAILIVHYNGMMYCMYNGSIYRSMIHRLIRITLHTIQHIHKCLMLLYVLVKMEQKSQFLLNCSSLTESNLLSINLASTTSSIVHSCQVSRNDRDSPGILAFVPDVSRLTQKADNVPDFSQTLSLRAYRRHILSHQKLISLVEAKKVAFGTVLGTKP